MTRTEKLEEETFVDGFLVTEHAQKDDAEQWPPITESSVPPKKRVKTTASRKTCAPRDASPANVSADASSEKVPRSREGGDRDDDTVGYEDEAPPRAAPTPALLASFDAAAASSSEDEEEEETSGQRPRCQYRGVSPSGSITNPWRTRGISIDGKPVYLGSHATEEEAARVYDKYLREHNLIGTGRVGYEKWLNFPLPGEEEAARRAKKPLSRRLSSSSSAVGKKPSLTEQRDAVRLERDMLRAGRETVASERDALLAELDALRSESAAAVSERDALRAVLDAACAEHRLERDALRSERDVLQGENATMSLFNDKLLAKLAPA